MRQIVLCEIPNIVLEWYVVRADKKSLHMAWLSDGEPRVMCVCLRLKHASVLCCVVSLWELSSGYTVTVV